MIGTLLWINWTNLRRDRVALALSFVLPIVFFSLFAVVFNRPPSETPRIRVTVIDLDESEVSRRLSIALNNEDALRMVDLVAEGDTTTVEPRERAAEAIRNAKVAVVIVIPPGFGSAFPSFYGGGGPALKLFTDSSNPIAPPIVAGLLQKAAFASMPDLMMRHGVDLMGRFFGGVTAAQRDQVEAVAAQMRSSTASAPAASAPGAAAGGNGLIPTQIIDVLGQTKRSPLIAVLAAGNAVMFLLFAASGAAGSLLDEEETGALGRMLTAGVSMTTLLAGKWLFVVLLGAAQVVLMFAWAALVFKLEVFEPQRFVGFVIMTLATAAAAAGFGLLLATLCRTRAQLAGISTIIILMMSALGGSMVPRFALPELVRQIGVVTFNYWALEGYQQVFWYDKPPSGTLFYAGVLLGLTAIFLTAARLLARRWETV